MDIGVPFKDLGPVNTDELREAIFTLDEAVWTENEYRQQAYSQHSDTQSIVLLFTNGENWPNIEVTKENGWDLLSEHVVPIMNQLLCEHYPSPSTPVTSNS